MGETIDYVANFDPEWYLSTYYNSIEGEEEEGDFCTFMHEFFHNSFLKRNISSENLLDIGTGPNISTILTSSRYISKIDLSDFTPANLEILNDWKKGKRELVIEIMKYEMEKHGDTRNMKTRCEELRNKVCNIFRVDVNDPELFIGACPEQDSKYDMISSTLCLEAATQSKVQYLAAVKNISKKLKSGGYFLIAGVLEQNFYRVGNYKFSCAYLTKDDIQEIFIKCNYDILEMKSFNESQSAAKEPHDCFFSDFKDAFAMLAQYK